MNINHLILGAHQNAVNKGFWDNEKQILHKMKNGNQFTIEEVITVENAFRGLRMMLIVSELGEMLEGLRHDNMGNYREEFADVLIRCGDFAGGDRYLTDIVKDIESKMDKNKDRPRLHGKAF
jgi:hypothetical protein